MRTPKVMRQKEEGRICRLMARSGRLPSGFDYTLIEIIINTKKIRNCKLSLMQWKIIRFNGWGWWCWEENEIKVDKLGNVDFLYMLDFEWFKLKGSSENGFQTTLWFIWQTRLEDLRRETLNFGFFGLLFFLSSLLRFNRFQCGELFGDTLFDFRQAGRFCFVVGFF